MLKIPEPIMKPNAKFRERLNKNSVSVTIPRTTPHQAATAIARDKCEMRRRPNIVRGSTRNSDSQAPTIHNGMLRPSMMAIHEFSSHQTGVVAMVSVAAKQAPATAYDICATRLILILHLRFQMCLTL